MSLDKPLSTAIARTFCLASACSVEPFEPPWIGPMGACVTWPGVAGSCEPGAADEVPARPACVNRGDMPMGVPGGNPRPGGADGVPTLKPGAAGMPGGSPNGCRGCCGVPRRLFPCSSSATRASTEVEASSSEGRSSSNRSKSAKPHFLPAMINEAAKQENTSAVIYRLKRRRSLRLAGGILFLTWLPQDT